MTSTTTADVDGRRFLVGGRLLHTARLAGDGYEFLLDPEAAARGLRSGDARVDLLTFTPSVRDAPRRHPYYFERENVAVLPIHTYQAWWTDQVAGPVRTAVRAAVKKGVRVRETAFDDALVRGISSVYNESPVRQGMKFSHYGKDLATVRADNATFLDRAVFLGAYVAEELVGFAKLVIDVEQGQAGVMQILGMLRHRDKSVANALVADAVRACAERGIASLVYSTFGLAPRGQHGLNEFKIANGFRPADLPRYYVPLTTLGRLALATRLHRRLADQMPRSVAVRLKSLRTRWYATRVIGLRGTGPG